MKQLQRVALQGWIKVMKMQEPDINVVNAVNMMLLYKPVQKKID